MNIAVIERYVSKIDDLNEILNEYRKMREMLIENGNVDSDLPKGLNMHWGLFSQKTLIQNLILKLVTKMMDYGILKENDVSEFHKLYLYPKLTKIDEETPLNNGNKKSNNRRK